MNPVEVTVNGRLHRSAVSPRMSLADFLRDDIGLTGTHLGCEHGICGACTVLIDGQISRSCITYAVSCDGATVDTIEGLDDDPVMAELRRTFSEEHALQCGYCTPGMLITARDILSRHKTLTPAQIRHELSGNLCRCTGYRGIVRAIARVAELPVAADRQQNTSGFGPAPGARAGVRQTVSVAAEAVIQGSTTLPAVDSVPAGSADITVSVSEASQSDGWITIAQTFTLPHPRGKVWPLLSDLEDVCAALPGIELDGPPLDGVVSGASTIEGEGSDRRTHSRVKARIQNRLIDLDQKSTRVEVEFGYTITGPLAQFGRSSIVRNLVARLATTFAQNVNATLSGQPAASAAPARFWDWWKKILTPLCRFAALFGGRRPR